MLPEGTLSNLASMRSLLLVLLLVTAGFAKEKTVPHAGTGLSFPPILQAGGKVWTRDLVEELQDPAAPKVPQLIIDYSSGDAILTLYVFSAYGSTAVTSEPFQETWKAAQSAIAMMSSGARPTTEGPFQVKGGPTQGLRAVYALSGERSELIQLLWRGYCVKVRASHVRENDATAFLQALPWPKKP